jgi:hypothetical protein
VAKQTLEQPGSANVKLPIPTEKNSRKQITKKVRGRLGYPRLPTEQKIRSNDRDAYVDKGKQALSNVHSRTASHLLWARL